MKRLCLILALLSIGSLAESREFRARFNPFTGKPDFYVQIDSNTIQAGAGISISGDVNFGTVTITAAGGAASNLETIFDITRTSPTATLKGKDGQFKGSVSGSTMTFSIDVDSFTALGASPDHTLLSNIGSFTHAQIDSQIGDIQTSTGTLATRLDAVGVDTTTIALTQVDLDTGVVSGSTLSYERLNSTVAATSKNQTFTEPQTIDSSFTVKNDILTPGHVQASSVNVTNSYYLNNHRMIWDGEYIASTNIFIGEGSGNSTATSPISNICIGLDTCGALASNAHQNVCVGTNNCDEITTGDQNTVIGDNSGTILTTGEENTFIGQLVARDCSTCTANTFVGYLSGDRLVDGLYNVGVGNGAANDFENAFDNTCIGRKACAGIVHGSSNTLIGSQELRDHSERTEASVGIGYGIQIGMAGGGSSRNAIAIGNNAIVDSSNTAVIGGTGVDTVNVIISTLTMRASGPIHFRDADSSNIVTLRSSETVANDFTIRLPDTKGTSGQVLHSDGGGGMFWDTDDSAGATDPQVHLDTGPVTGTVLSAVYYVSTATFKDVDNEWSAPQTHGSSVTVNSFLEVTSTATIANVTVSTTIVSEPPYVSRSTGTMIGTSMNLQPYTGQTLCPLNVWDNTGALTFVVGFDGVTDINNRVDMNSNADSTTPQAGDKNGLRFWNYSDVPENFVSIHLDNASEQDSAGIYMVNVTTAGQFGGDIEREGRILFYTGTAADGLNTERMRIDEFAHTQVKGQFGVYGGTATFTSSMTLSGGYMVQNIPPSSGEVLKFDGTNWAPGTDLSAGGGGGASSLAVTIGPVRSSPTSDILFNPDQMIGSVTSTSITVTMDGSSVTLLGPSIQDAEVDNDITLTNITQITNRSHTNLSDIGTFTHAQIDTQIAGLQTSTTTLNSDIQNKIVDASTGIANVNAGTDLTADLEEETHASEHEAGGADALDLANIAGVLGYAVHLGTGGVMGTLAPDHLVSTHAYTTDVSTKCFDVNVSSGLGYDGFNEPIKTVYKQFDIFSVTAYSLPSGTTVMYQIDEAASDFDSAGTNVFTVNHSSANYTGRTENSFSNASIAAGSTMVLNTPSSSSTGGSPRSLHVHICGTWQRD